MLYDKIHHGGIEPRWQMSKGSDHLIVSKERR